MAKQILRFAWPAKLTRNRKSGTTLVSFRDLPDCLTEGNSRDDALDEAADALEEAIAWRLAQGEDIPAPSTPRGREAMVALSPLFAAKAALHIALRREGISRSALARRLKCDEKEIRRLLDPRHGSRIERIADALSQLSGRLTVTLEAA